MNVAYLYDAEHQRLKQTIGSNTTVYLNDPASGASSEKQSAGGGTWQDAIFADGERVSVRTQTTSPATTSFQYFVQDHLGSVAVIMNQAGSVTQRLGYDAWGRRRQPNGTEYASGSTITAPSTTRGYTDHEHIDDVDLINMNARMYDPEMGRFLSPDSIIPNVFQSQALNRYSYVYNNPAKYTDPTGHCAELNSCVVEIIVKYILPSALLGGWFGSDSDDAPPPHHLPGLASVNENLRGTTPIHDVSASHNGIDTNAGVAEASKAGSSTGTKYANGADSEAFSYVRPEEEAFLAATILAIPSGAWSTEGIRQAGVRIITYTGAVVETGSAATAGVFLMLMAIPTIFLIAIMGAIVLRYIVWEIKIPTGNRVWENKNLAMRHLGR